MASPTFSPYNRPEILKPEDELRNLYIGMEQIKKQLNGLKPGTPEYVKILANKTATQKRIDELNKITNEGVQATKTQKSNTDRQKLVDAVTRAQDYGTTDEVTKAQNKLDSFNNVNKTVVPEGAKDADTDGDGIPDSKDKNPKVADKPGDTPKVVTPKVVTPPKVTSDAKTAYISSLRETFKTLPKEYKGQIDKLFTAAAAGVWDEKAFMAELEKTTWWQSELPSLQKFFVETNDPRKVGTFAEKLRNNIDSVQSKLETLGIQATQVDPVTGKFYDNSKVIEGIAMNAIKNGWNDSQLMQHLGDTAQLHFTGGGSIGSSVDTIKKQALMYGVSIDNNYLNTIQHSLLDPTDGRDSQYYMNEMKNQAMDLYKPFAQSIKDGRSLYEVTNSYRSQMANLLEVDSTNVSWKDLMNKVIDPKTGNARMFSEFTKEVKADPLWQYTKNAKDTYSNMALDLMKQFGFMG